MIKCSFIMITTLLAIQHQLLPVTNPQSSIKQELRAACKLKCPQIVALLDALKEFLAATLWVWEEPCGLAVIIQHSLKGVICSDWLRAGGTGGTDGSSACILEWGEISLVEHLLGQRKVSLWGRRRHSKEQNHKIIHHHFCKGK